MDGVIKLGGEYVSGILDAYSSFWVGAILGEVGKTLSQGPVGYHNISGGNGFFGSNEIETDINLLEKFYDSRNTFGKQGDIEVQNVARYKSTIEMHYGKLKSALKLLESNINSITKVKTVTDLRDYKIKMMKGLKSLIKDCNSVIGTAGFDSFRIEHIIEFIQKLRDKEPQALKDLGLEKFGGEYKLEGINIQLTQETQKNLAKLKMSQLSGCGTFADFVVYLKQTAEDSFENLKKNVKGQCVIFISRVDGSFDINREKFDVKSSVITKGRDIHFDEDEMNTFRRDIGNKSVEKSRVYIKEINKMYEPCVNVHDKVKELYWKVNNLSIELNLTCLKNVKEKLKEYLDSIHFFVFGSEKCVCSKDKNFEDSGSTIDSEMVIFAKKIYELFNFQSENALINDKKVQNTIYVKKMCENLKAIYKQIKYLEKLSVELYKTAFKIKKEYEIKMGKIKKLAVRFSDIPFWFASKMMRVGESCEDSVKKVGTLEKLTEALKGYIKYLERAYKFKKEILPKYIALEKSVEDFKRKEDLKNFTELKGKIERLNLGKDIDFSGFKRLLNGAKKEVNEAIKKARKAAKGQKKQNRSNSAHGNSHPPIPV